MTRQNLIVALFALIWAVFTVAALQPSLGLNAVTLVGIAIIVIYVLRLLEREDAVYSIAGAIIGGLLVLLVPQFALAAAGGEIVLLGFSALLVSQT